MEYDFTVDLYQQPRAQFSMGFEAIGTWFNEELGSNQHQIEQLLGTVKKLSERQLFEIEIEGRAYRLLLGRDTVQVYALALGFEFEGELPEETQLYNDESHATCGLLDFQQALTAWLEFVQDL